MKNQSSSLSLAIIFSIVFLYIYTYTYVHIVFSKCSKRYIYMFHFIISRDLFKKETMTQRSRVVIPPVKGITRDIINIPLKLCLRQYLIENIRLNIITFFSIQTQISTSVDKFLNSNSWKELRNVGSAGMDNNAEAVLFLCHLINGQNSIVSVLASCLFCSKYR